MSDDKKQLACQIKTEVTALVASGKFKIEHMTYLNNWELPCGCAIGVVATLAAGSASEALEGCATRRGGLIGQIQKQWPELSYDDLRNMECAFEGWNNYSADSWDSQNRTEIDKDNEFYKLGLYIASLA